MSDSSQKIALYKKTYETVYALFRVAAVARESGIADTLKGNAALILSEVIAENYEKTEKPLLALDYFVKLGMDLGFISFANGEVLVKEMGNLKAMIAGCAQAGKEDVDISSLFSPETDHPSQGVSSRDFFSREEIAVSRAEEYPMGATVKQGNSFRTSADGDSSSIIKESSAVDDGPSGNNASGGFLKSGMRQIAILDKIRQSGSCRMRDIQEILPDSSERTLRYDLEGLIERKLIERTGNGGPSVAYRMRQM